MEKWDVVDYIIVFCPTKICHVNFINENDIVNLKESAASDKDSGMGQESPPGPEEDIGGQSEASILATSKADERVYAFLVRLTGVHPTR